MKDVSQYPVSTPYGYVPGYPLNGGYHRGEDRAAPLGTPVIVNGVKIGEVGSTGASTGNHLHVGRFVGGKDTHPRGGGFKVNGAVVNSVGYDSSNGNHVRINDADGSVWVYLHLSKITVSKGQVLKEEVKMPTWNDGDIVNAKRFETGVADYQPPGSELEYYKRPENEKALLYDTIKGGQVQIDLATDATYEKIGTINGEDIYRRRK